MSVRQPTSFSNVIYRFPRRVIRPAMDQEGVGGLVAIRCPHKQPTFNFLVSIVRLPRYS